MFLMIGGELGNFMAYGFAPASLVAPLGSVAVIANAIIAFVFLREPISMPSMMGVTLVIVSIHVRVCLVILKLFYFEINCVGKI